MPFLSNSQPLQIKDKSSFVISGFWVIVARVLRDIFHITWVMDNHEENFKGNRVLGGYSHDLPISFSFVVTLMTYRDETFPLDPSPISRTRLVQPSNFDESSSQGLVWITLR